MSTSIHHSFSLLWTRCNQSPWIPCTMPSPPPQTVPSNCGPKTNSSIWSLQGGCNLHRGGSMWTSVPIPAPIWNLSSVICIMHHKSRAREAKTGGSWGLTGQTVEPKWWVQSSLKESVSREQGEQLDTRPQPLAFTCSHRGKCTCTHTSTAHICMHMSAHIHTEKENYYIIQHKALNLSYNNFFY